MHLNARKFLSNLVPQCLRTFCNGLLRFTRNDGQFTVHHSQSTQTAFTLAETLIVIGIIGVVAALTLPNLNHATGDKEKVTKVKKIYSALTDAFERAQVVYGPYDEWYKDLSTVAEMNERFAKRVTEFMKVSKDCGFDEGCFSSAPLIWSNAVEEENYLDSLKSIKTYMLTLSDGVSLGFFSSQKIKVDIDGPNKGKNQEGFDIFDFTIYKNSLIPSFKLDGSTCHAESHCLSSYLTSWVIENGNMDYLKATESDEGFTCPNGKVLDWTSNTSCN